MKRLRFKNLEAEFTRIDMSVDEIGQKLGFAKCTLYNRLNCKTNWTLNDMLKVQEFVNDKTKSHHTLDYLFAKEV